MKSNAKDYSEFPALAVEIINAKEVKKWVCPGCHCLVQIAFETNKHGRTGLRIRCVGCSANYCTDGEFSVPKWYRETKI
jgi:hypothetical protein